MNLVAPLIFVPSTVTATSVPRCAPVGLTLCSVGGAVWADAIDATARMAMVRLTTGVGLHRTTYLLLALIRITNRESRIAESLNPSSRFTDSMIQD
jgi:hypothetical protein